MLFCYCWRLKLHNMRIRLIQPFRQQGTYFKRARISFETLLSEELEIRKNVWFVRSEFSIFFKSMIFYEICVGHYSIFKIIAKSLHKWHKWQYSKITRYSKFAALHFMLAPIAFFCFTEPSASFIIRAT